MKFLIKRNSDQGRAKIEAQEGFDISNTAITWVSIIYIIVNIIANSLSNYISNKPQRDIDNDTFELKEQNFKVQIFQRILESDSAIDRQASLRLMTKTDFFNEKEKAQLLSYIEHNNYVPKWPKRNLEILNSYLFSGGNGYFGSGYFPLGSSGPPSSAPPAQAIPSTSTGGSKTR